jgi:hypothetical protein
MLINALFRLKQGVSNSQFEPNDKILEPQDLFVFLKKINLVNNIHVDDSY